MSNILISAGDFIIQKGSALVTAGLILCWLITALLYSKKEKSSALFVFFPLSFLSGLFFSRLLHWYFNMEFYGSFINAFTDFSSGSFVLPGAFIGVMLSALAVGHFRLTSDRRLLLDCAAPGLCLFVAFVRASAYFNSSCRSKITITEREFKTFPFSVKTDSGYKLATFALEAIAVMLLFIALMLLFSKCMKNRYKTGCPAFGHVWNWFLVIYGAIEIISDSTRSDSPIMHFNFLSDLNQYSAFISIAQIFAAVCALVVVINYGIYSIRSNGFKIYHIPCFAGFAVSLFGIGKLGEYEIQRTADFQRGYAFMAGSCILMIIMIYILYASCKEGKEKDAAEQIQ